MEHTISNYPTKEQIESAVLTLAQNKHENEKEFTKVAKEISRSMIELGYYVNPEQLSDNCLGIMIGIIIGRIIEREDWIKPYEEL